MKQEPKMTFSYEPPEIEAVEVHVEQGFAGSDTGGNTSDWDPIPGKWQ